MRREFPAVIAVALQEYEGEEQPFRKLHRLVDVFETIIKYAAIIAIQDFYRLRLENKYRSVSEEIRRRIHRAPLGEWIENLLYLPAECLQNNPKRSFCP
ncbi:MAG: hypothetical protein N2651_03495, partial [Fimbriimonadales bacterium]|nr:hypothetical protein [Fimbriimonadales bacterium]